MKLVLYGRMPCVDTQPTKEDALYDFIKRGERHIRICRNNIMTTEAALLEASIKLKGLQAKDKVGSGLDLKKLERKLEEALTKETPESLQEWMDKFEKNESTT